MALRAVAAGEDFTASARELGAATAEVHALLASVMPTQEVTPEAVTATAAGMRRRYVAAASEVPAIAAYDHEIAAVFDEAVASPWPPLQRIHGDYHLGQVLQVPGRGWVLLDFEGEPCVRSRSATDPTSRSGTSPGCCARSTTPPGRGSAPTPGCPRASGRRTPSSAFLDGYAASAGRDPRQDSALLTALQLDKALYEIVYEARNRPTWLSIPTDAVVRLLDEARKAIR